MKNISGMALILIIAASGGGFYGGMKYQESKLPSTGQFMMGQGGQKFQAQPGGTGSTGRNMMRGSQGFRPVSGEIINSDDKSITVKTDDDTSKIVLISAKTSINKSSEGTITDLKIGETVAIFGNENSDGSITAQNVQLNPQIRQISVTKQPEQ